MSKAFTRENDTPDDDELDDPAPLPQGFKNYMTPPGFQRMQEELRHLLRVERPKVVEVVSWAAGNGDRSENGITSMARSACARSTVASAS